MAQERDYRQIFVKTEQGAAEAATRKALHLPSARRVLILMDGRRTVGEISLMVRPGELEGILAMLEGGGFVKLAGIASHMPQDRTESDIYGFSAASLHDIRHKLEDLFEPYLGAQALPVEQAIRQATSIEDIRRHVRTGIDLLEARHGKASAEIMVQAIRAILHIPL